jgi:hypothetical protein
MRDRMPESWQHLHLIDNETILTVRTEDNQAGDKESYVARYELTPFGIYKTDCRNGVRILVEAEEAVQLYEVSILWWKSRNSYYHMLNEHAGMHFSIPEEHPFRIRYL